MRALLTGPRWCLLPLLLCFALLFLDLPSSSLAQRRDVRKPRPTPPDAPKAFQPDAGLGPPAPLKEPGLVSTPKAAPTQRRERVVPADVPRAKEGGPVKVDLVTPLKQAGRGGAVGKKKEGREAAFPTDDAKEGAAPRLKGGVNGWLKDINSEVQEPYLLNIGSAKGLSDLMEDDVVHPAYTAKDDSAKGEGAGNEVQELADFYIWRKQGPNEDADKPRSITVQRPVVFVEDDSVASTSVANWGARSMRLLAPSGGQEGPDKHLLFTLQSTCKKSGVTAITITLRTFEMTQGQRSKDTVEFTVRRVCAGAFGAGVASDSLDAPAADSPDKSTVESTPIPGFEVYLTRGKAKGEQVLQHGQPRPKFKPREASDADAKDSSHMHVVGPKKSREDLIFSYTGDGDLLLKRPIIVVEQPSVFTVTESLGALGTVTTGNERQFSLSFSCLTGGSSPFTVIFTFGHDNAASQVSFGMVKECSGANRVEGVAGLHVDVGTAIGGRDVVTDGETQPAYKGVTKWSAKSWKGRAAAFDESTATATFYLTTANDDGYGYDQPVITAFTEDGAVIAHPLVSGSLTTADPLQLKSSSPLELVLEFRCEAEGLFAVTINVRFTNAGAVQWTVRKQCSQPTEAEVQERKVEDAEGLEKNREMGLSLREGNQTDPIPGVNVGFSRSAHGQMWNGVVNKDFRLRESSNELAICPGNRHFLTFYLYQNKSEKGAVDVTYGKPELITTSDVSSPILTGSLDGGVVNATHHASFTITFHCHSDGETMYTLTIPLLPSSRRSPPPRSSLVLSFLKACNMTASASAAEMGGLGIQGFSIGRSEGANDVIRDGFPTPSYFGQKNKDKPEWDDVIVPVAELSTSLFFSYTGGDNIGEATLTFQPPLLVTHSSLFKPVLSGPATHGGFLTKNSLLSPPHLDITWNCKFAGLVTLNLLIPVAEGQITFTMPKMCGGKPVPQGMVHKGLMIGLTPGGSEVVKNGLVEKLFADRQYEVKEDESVTTFYLRQETGVFQAIEPMVRSHRSIALPMLQHDLYVSKGAGGELLKAEEAEAAQGKVAKLVEEAAAKGGDSDLVADELDDVYLDAAGATLNVSYSCLDAGSTGVTITIPLKVGYLEWTWRKLCPAASDWGMGDLGEIGIAGIKPGGIGIKREEEELPSMAQQQKAGKAPADAKASIMARTDGGAGGDWGDFGDDWGAMEAARAHRLIAQERVEGDFVNDPLESHLTPEDATFTDIRHVIVASSRPKAKQLQGDVFEKRLQQRYTRPTQGAKAGQHALIDAALDRTSFWIASTRTLRIAQPSVVVPEEFKGRRVVIDARVSLRTTGNTTVGPTTVSRGAEPVELVIDWQCRRGKGGFTPVYVSLPLEPQPAAGRVQFYLTKVCPGDEDMGGGAGRGSSLYGLILVGVALSVMGLMYYGYGREKELRIMLSEQLSGMRNGRHTDTLQRGTYQIVNQKDAPKGSSG